MKPEKYIHYFLMTVTLLIGQIFVQSAIAVVLKDENRTYLIDRTGERWDITQAVSIGFEPRFFEFGIGRNAFRPLDESDWSKDQPNVRSKLRVIGIAKGDEAHAYSVPRLSRHETANTVVGSEPIAVGY
jgi:hypothetical protein